MSPKEKVAIIGSGLIGQSWGMIFAASGYKVVFYDIDPKRIEAALKAIEDQLISLESKKILRGKLSAKQQLDLMSGSQSLKDTVSNSFWVQECVFEDVDLKRKVFEELDNYVTDTTILASSTSFIPPSRFMENLKHRSNALVNHPVNPPYFAPLTELVRSPWTCNETVAKARSILKEAGQVPVEVKKEVPGFIINRLQDAIFAEAYRLIDDDVITVEDLDAVMSEGLGMRYAFMGPWETAHLNANGMVEYFEKYAKGIYDVQQTFGPNKYMEGPTAQKIIDAMVKKVPMDKLAERRKWRDEKMIALSQIKKS